MIQCPWCSKTVKLENDICPECRHEVLPEHLSPTREGNEEVPMDLPSDFEMSDLTIEEAIANKFKCVKCGNPECFVKETAMTGTGLSKLFDIQYNHYLFVSCTNCGYVEIYNPDVLSGHKSGQLGTILDLLFGN